MINPFFVPVTHVALIFDAIEGVALIGLATLFGIGLALWRCGAASSLGDQSSRV